MKHLLVFLGLKIVEILAIVFLPYWIGSIPWINKKSEAEHPMSKWCDGILVIFIVSLVIIAGYSIIYLNWQWAGELIGGGK